MSLDKDSHKLEHLTRKNSNSAFKPIKQPAIKPITFAENNLQPQEIIKIEGQVNYTID